MTILLVEDEPAIRRLMAIELEGAGYRIVEARNGKEALTAFGPDVDLLLTDMRLPFLEGAQVIERLRARRRTLKVLAFSGYPLNAPEGVPFLSKPFKRDESLRAVRQALGE